MHIYCNGKHNGPCPSAKFTAISRVVPGVHNKNIACIEHVLLTSVLLENDLILFIGHVRYCFIPVCLFDAKDIHII